LALRSTMSDEVTEQIQDDISSHQLPGKTNKLFLKAEAALETRNWGYAISLLQAVVASAPGFLHGRKMVRSAAIKENEGKKGIKLGAEALKVLKMKSEVKKDALAVMKALEKDVLASDPYNPQGNELFYEAAIEAGLPMTAGYALQTITEGHPDNLKYFHKLGDFYMDREAFDKASEIFSKMVEKDRTDLEAAKKFKDATAKASIASQKWDSEGDWRDLLKDKDQATNLEKEGRAAMTPEMLQEQANRLLQEYAANQNDVEVSKRLGQTYEDLEQWNEAVQYYEWAFHLSGNDPSLEKKVGEMRDKANAKYLRDLQEFIDANPDHPDVEQYQEQLKAARLEQLSTGIDEAQARVDRNPTDTELRFELGERLYEAERYRDAIQHLQQAKTSPNLRVRVMGMLGRCYTQMNMLDLAKGQMEEALSELTGMDDTKKDLLYDLALLCERMENRDQYLDALKQIYAVDYNYKDVANRVENSYMDE
ncbi:MAG: hypothetical protein AAF226_09865, partial [Verrucomicrobiota bacterium]